MNVSDLHNLVAVLLIGCGNIGSHLLPLLARNPLIGALMLVDPDRFELRNVTSQAIGREAAGRPKAAFLARVARSIRPGLPVSAIMAAVETIPLGLLRATMIIACVDSRRARMATNQIASRLGIPWIDTAVGPDDMLARVNVYVPGPDAPCLECMWDGADYAAVEQVHACGATATAPTAGPAELGAFAASLAAVECDKLIRGDLESSLAGKQLMVGLHHPSHDITTLRRNPACRFDHETLNLESRPTDVRATTLADFIGNPGRDDWRLGVEGFRFSRRQACTCGREQSRLAVTERHLAEGSACPGCGGPMRVVGFHTRAQVGPGEIPPCEMARTLADIGLRQHDVLTLQSNGHRRAIELTPLQTTEKKP